MKKSLAALAALIGALATLVLPASTAHAYPDPTITIEIPGDLLYGGDDVTISASASVSCETWTMVYLGQTATGSGTSITNTFDTPVVQEIRRDPVTVTCVYDETAIQQSSAPVGSGTASATEAAFALPGLASVSRSATVTLLPRGAGDGDGDDDGGLAGVLPDTGGASFWLLLAGAALVVVGGGVALRRRA